MNDDALDAELWERAAGGEAAAFGALFDRHARAVYNYCFRRTAGWSTAEDLTSVVFLEAWRRRADVRLTGDSLLPWLLGVANNVVRNANRSLRRYRGALARLPAQRAEPDPSDDVAARIDDERRMRSLLELIRRLPRPTRKSSPCVGGPGSATPTPAPRSVCRSARCGRGCPAPALASGSWGTRRPTRNPPCSPDTEKVSADRHSG